MSLSGKERKNGLYLHLFVAIVNLPFTNVATAIGNNNLVQGLVCVWYITELESEMFITIVSAYHSQYLTSFVHL